MALILPNHKLEEIPAILFSELRKGTIQKKHPFRNVVLSTISENQPKSRWVVLRKLTTQQQFLIYTDSRSEKIRALKKNSNCSLLFYHSRHGLQIRIEGNITIHQNNELTNKYWPGIKGNGIKSYTTHLPPGTKINDKAKGNQWIENHDGLFFNILEVTPYKIDVLQLDRIAHIRATFTRNTEEWRGTFLVP